MTDVAASIAGDGPLSRRRALGLVGAGLLAGCAGVASVRPAGCRPDASGVDGTTEIGLVGDLMLGRGVDAARRDDPPAGVWGSAHDRLTSLDGVVGNLECCLSDRGSPRPDRTYTFRADPDWAVPALSAGNVAWLSLANNHLLDFGPGALLDTVDHLGAAGIGAAGAGRDLATARAPSTVEIGDLDVAFVAFTDRYGAYAAGPGRPGTAYLELDPARAATRRAVRTALRAAASADPDLVVASLHWGPNWETRPGRTHRGFARWAIDAGVDVVHGHSAHVFHGIEVHRGRPILYDAGDFVDDYAVKAGLHNDRSFLFELDVDGGRPASLRAVPVEIENGAVDLADAEAAGWLRGTLRRRSGALGTDLVRDGDGLRLDLPGC